MILLFTGLWRLRSIETAAIKTAFWLTSCRKINSLETMFSCPVFLCSIFSTLIRPNTNSTFHIWKTLVFKKAFCRMRKELVFKIDESTSVKKKKSILCCWSVKRLREFYPQVVLYDWRIDFFRSHSHESEYRRQSYNAFPPAGKIMQAASFQQHNIDFFLLHRSRSSNLKI